MDKEENVLLRIHDLCVRLRQNEQNRALIQHVNFDLERGQVLGLVGESGSGKTMTSTAILQLHNPNAIQVSGSIKLKGRELNGLGNKEMRRIRGRDIAFIMQNPMNAFTPVFTIGHQLVETIRSHTTLSKKEAKKRAVEALEQVNLPNPDQLLKQYPFQLSGGMLQRVMIAFAACLRPSVIIADEPTTALDLHNQFAVLQHLNDIREKYGTAILLISHDLGVIAEMADHVAVMQNGTIVEEAGVFDLFDRPEHPYTQKLLNTRPSFH